MQNKEKSEKMTTAVTLFALLVMLLSCYRQCGPILGPRGYTNEYLNMVVVMYNEFLDDLLTLKAFILLLVICASVFRIGKKVDKGWPHIAAYSAAGTLLFLYSPANGILYTLTGITGMVVCIYGYSLIFRKLKGEGVQPDDNEGFEQTKKFIWTKDSVNIPYIFHWKGRDHKGWINCINPFRASMVMGSPGSGKSFAIYNAFIEQTIRKGYTMFVYDYKFPDLTERVLTEIAYQTRHEKLWKDMKTKPRVYIINFDDPVRSNRCNPIHHSYITDPADSTEIADLVFKNINKGEDSKGFDFFNESAKVYLDALVWFLANYDPDAVYNNTEGLRWYLENRGPEAYEALNADVRLNADGMTAIDSKTDYANKGRFCTFPHLIEVMAYAYEKVFQILQCTRGLEAKISPFSSALEGGAMEQLQGQMASAQIPMGRFVSPALYWVMSGGDFTLDFNNPGEPKIICMGNNPDRQGIYGTTLALYTSRMFKLINHKHKLKSVVLLDEVPTIFVKGLDNLIATARSNKVAIVLGAQDKSQLRRDYGDKESEVIMTTVGNVFSGSVEGRTAEDLSKTFGKEFRKRVSESINDDGGSKSVSYQLEDILPASAIVDMSQGTFCGWIKDNFGETISRKKFHGAVTVDMERNRALDSEAVTVPYITDMLGDENTVMNETTKARLKMMHPALADNEEALQKKYIDELVQKKLTDNFNSIKTEVRNLIESEYERTAPIAKALAEKRAKKDK